MRNLQTFGAEQFEQTLRQGGIGHVFRIYPGGHPATLWSSEAPAWLSLALGYLSTHRDIRLASTPELLR